MKHGNLHKPEHPSPCWAGERRCSGWPSVSSSRSRFIHVAWARALILLTDGCGPFDDVRAQRRMSDAVWWIADGLQP
jgi:hypothetical protein